MHDSRKDRKDIWAFVAGLLMAFLSIVLLEKRREDKDTSYTKKISELPDANPHIDKEVPLEICSLDVQSYSTNPTEFRTWVDILFEKIKLPLPITATMIGLVPFLGGLLISSTIGFEIEYLQTIPIYIGAFGIAWVLGVIRYASRSVHRVYEELRPCFLVTDREYSSVIKTWFERMRSHRGNFWAAGFLTLLAWVVVYFSFFQSDLIQRINLTSLRPYIFPQYWYTSQNLPIKALIIAYWGVYVALPLATAGRILVYNFLFLLSLRHWPVIPIPSVVRMRLQVTNNLYILVSMTWFVGVALFGFVLFDVLDILSLVFLSILSLFGTLTFLTPQLIYRLYLVHSQKLASQWILSCFYDRLHIQLEERRLNIIPTKLGSEVAGLESLKDFVEASKKSDTWVYDPSDFVFLIIGQIVSFGSVYLENLLKSILP